jgi:5'-3' exonuclease
MSKLEVVTGDVLRAKYGIGPEQYSDFAVMRGDASDGLPGVAGIGEKTAAHLLSDYGSLDGIIAAAADDHDRLSPTVRRRILDAAEYLAVAPRVVDVVRDLDLDEADARIRPLTQPQREAVAGLAERWGLGGSAERALRALGNDTSVAD